MSSKAGKCSNSRGMLYKAVSGNGGLVFTGTFDTDTLRFESVKILENCVVRSFYTA